MKKMLVRLVLSALGVAVTLLWWTYRDRGSHAQSLEHIPAEIAGGGNQLEIEATASTAATLRITFEDVNKPAGQQILAEAWEKMPAGTHTWRVNVPAGVGGYIELNADQPNAGDTLSQRIKMNGKSLDEETERLDRPLEPNTAFFVQYHAEDFSAPAGTGDRE